MLKGDARELDMMAERDRLLAECESELQELQERFGFLPLASSTGLSR